MTDAVVFFSYPRQARLKRDLLNWLVKEVFDKMHLLSALIGPLGTNVLVYHISLQSGNSFLDSSSLQASEFDRGRIIRLKEECWSNRRIARHMGRSDAAIRRCWQELVDNGRFQSHDRFRVILIVRSAVTAPNSSLSTIRLVTLTRIFTMTIHKRLIEQNLLSYRPLRLLPLMPAHNRARLQWCFAASSWNHADWGCIVFSD
ncbi:HTH_Tnp_Tc3_2 domain-containing protein [Trichonephila clavipes]|uniref:HTH_Tnp_Tc3_2 domain-containing protein n=1 Tax=Trichonephila clavipes TaxID=2585209 RepID=A0A8X6S4D8_TRICX|nr:HTH_Tnp_Tc3_2 domain-containing protein [Trichonephila clavipes]